MNTKKLFLTILVCIFTSWSFAAVNVNLLAGKIATVVTGNEPPWVTGSHSDPAFITDGDEDSWWVNNNGGTDHTLTFELDEPSTINSFRLLSRNYSTDKPTKIAIFVSETDNADGSFTSVVEKTTNFKDDMTFELDAPVAAKYVRLELTMRSTWDCMAINDFKVWGVVGTGPIEPEKPFVPVVISGFNKDLIAESIPSKNHTSAGANDDKWVFYTTDIKAQGGLPSDGTIISAKGITYQLAEYGSNNVLWNNSYKASPVLNFVKPIKAKAISLLMTAANGDCQIENGTINYDDGTIAPLNISSIQDWGTGSPDNYAITGLGRIKRELKDLSDMVSPDEFDSKTDFSLFESRVDTDPEKTIESITIKESTGNYLMIFAISAIDMSEEPVEENTLSVDAVSDLDLTVGAKETIMANYSLGGAVKADNFGISVTPENSEIVTMTDFYNDEAAGTIEMELKGVSAGSTPVKIKLVNGNFEKEISFTVTVAPGNTLVIDNIPDQDFIVDTKESITATYSLGGAEKADNFSLAVTPENGDIVTADFTNDEVAGTIKIDLEGKSVGSTLVKVKLINGIFEKETSFTVTVAPGNTLVIDDISDLDFIVDTKESITATYSLGGAEKADNFSLAVTPENGDIVTADFTNDEVAGTIKIDLEGKSVGSTLVKVKLINGVFEKETSFTVTVAPGNTLVIDDIPDQDFIVDTKESITVTYSLGGAEKADNFSLAVTPENGDIVTADFTNDEVAGTIKIDLEGKSVGSTLVNVKLINGIFEKETSFTVTVAPGNTLVIDDISDLDFTIDTKESITATYSLGGAEKADNFSITATPENGNIVAVDLSNDEAAGTIKIDLEGKFVGSTLVNVKLINGIFEKETSFTVTVVKKSKIDNEDLAAVNVYPNPVNRGETLYVNSDNRSLIQIYSLEGVLLLQQKAINTQTEISVNNIPTGTYFLVISDNSGQKTTKIIVK